MAVGEVRLHRPKAVVVESVGKHEHLGDLASESAVCVRATEGQELCLTEVHRLWEENLM